MNRLRTTAPPFTDGAPLSDDIDSDDVRASGIPDVCDEAPPEAAGHHPTLHGAV